jgi:hypothetical protein
MNELLKKLEGVLQEADLNEIKKAIEDKIIEEASKMADLMVEEKVNELEKLSEEYVEQRIAEEKVKLEESKKADLELMESNLVENLDKFLDSEISNNISDEMLTKIAVNETLAPVVDGIRKVFEENHISLDSEGAVVIKEATEKLAMLESDNSKLIAEKMELNDKVALFEKAELLDSKVEGLSEDQQKRVFMMFESATISDINNKIDSFIDLVIKDENKTVLTEDDKTVKHEDIISEEDGIAETKPNLNEDTKGSSIGKAAAQYM